MRALLHPSRCLGVCLLSRVWLAVHRSTDCHRFFNDKTLFRYTLSQFSQLLSRSFYRSALVLLYRSYIHFLSQTTSKVVIVWRGSHPADYPVCVRARLPPSRFVLIPFINMLRSPRLSVSRHNRHSNFPTCMQPSTLCFCAAGALGSLWMVSSHQRWRQMLTNVSRQDQVR